MIPTVLLYVYAEGQQQPELLIVFAQNGFRSRKKASVE